MFFPEETRSKRAFSDIYFEHQYINPMPMWYLVYNLGAIFAPKMQLHNTQKF